MEETSVKDYIEHKVDSLKMAFPEMDERTLMIIATALVPDKFDSQLQEGVSLGMRHLNTMASVIDRTLGFQSSDDETHVPNVLRTGTSGPPPLASISGQSSQPSVSVPARSQGDIDAQITEKLDEFANKRLETMFDEFLQSDSFTTKIATAIAAAMSRSK